MKTGIQTLRPERFKIPIAVFLGGIFLVFFATVIATLSQELENILAIERIALQIRKESLPQFVDNQKTLANIEGLRRIAEVAYATNDIRLRRNARLNASALAAESVFQKDAGYAEAVNKISLDIGKLTRAKDALANFETQRDTIRQRYQSALAFFIEHIGDKQLRKSLLHLYTSNDLFVLANPGGSQKTSEAEPLQWDKDDQLVLTSLTVEHIVRTEPMLENKARELQRIFESSLVEIADLQQQSSTKYEDAKNLWQDIDYALRTMRDSVTTGAEKSIADALLTIHDATLQTQRSALFMFGLLVGFFILYYLLTYFFLIKPMRWTSQKLSEIQDGKLESPPPAIYIKEISEIAVLLERFSTHLSDIYAQTSQLAEDVAEKRDLEEVMRAVFKLSLDGYIVWNKKQLKRVSSGIVQLLEVDSEEALKEAWPFYGFTADALQRLFVDTLLDGFMREEMLLYTTKGASLPCEATHIPITFDEEQCILTYIRDLRQQKRNEEALRQAKEDAEVATKAKSDFLARMSHELRTPMNGVLGLTYLALQKSPAPEQKEFLSKIQSSAKLLLGIINDILDFSKIEEKKLELESIGFTVPGVVGVITDLLAPQAEAKNIQFNTRYEALSPSSEYLKGDSLRLTQVLLNLCGNAIKFTDSGFVALSVRTVSEDSASATLLFAVTDSGIGLHEEQMARLFQPFSQADSSTTRKHGGTGLGLMISKLLVELMGGSITVASEPGKGSTFSFTLIFAKETPEERQDALLPQQEEQVNFAGKKLLVAEDNMINQDIIESLLADFGCEITLVDNGQKAFDALQEHDYDCVLMDIQMPVMDGLASCRLIRSQAREAMRSVPVIAMTAHAMQEDVDKSMAAGMDDHLTKPIDVAALKNCLKKYLGG